MVLSKYGEWRNDVNLSKKNSNKARIVSMHRDSNEWLSRHGSADLKTMSG